MQKTRMVRLATLTSTFHARVIAARLGAEGIVTQLQGNLDGPYPMGDVHVYVGEDDLEPARELLLVDEVESAFDEGRDDVADANSPPAMWLVLGALLALAAVLVSRSF
jgi:hypothetical protein